MYCFFKEHDLLYESHNGFRTEHSTEMAARELIDRLILTMDNNETSLNIYLDMSKAFDTIYHTILINKLTFYGIHGIALDLIKSYLNNRYQFVEYAPKGAATRYDSLVRSLPIALYVGQS